MGKVITSILGHVCLGVIVLFHGLHAGITVESHNNEAFKNKAAAEIIREDLRNITENPNLVLWGIGNGGLTDRSLDFYEENVFNPMKEEFGAEGKCYFYDLSAWDTRTWRNKCNRPSPTFIKQYAGAEDLTAYFAGEGFNAEILFGSGLFTWLENLGPEVSAYATETILPQEFLWEKSKGRKATGTTVKRTKLGQEGSIFNGYGSMRIDYIYSPLQYMEAIFIVDYMMQKGATEITFFLPNTEFDYYTGAEDEHIAEFQRDLNQVITMLRGEINSEIKVVFLPFKYGTRDNARPYLFRKHLDRCVSWD